MQKNLKDLGVVCRVVTKEFSVLMTTTISGLTAGSTYDLIVYHADDHPSETVTVNGQSATALAGANGYTDVDDYHYFSGVASNGRGELVILSSGTIFQTICGFQVMPSPVAVLEQSTVESAAVGIVGDEAGSEEAEAKQPQRKNAASDETIGSIDNKDS